jgi:NAD(P)-dependent dehydrogenase (short-subunit alcohol dehydrogenase family)
MISFDERVAIVTGAGAGLGRSHALALAERGARVVVNDLGANLDGTGGSSGAAESVVAEIEAAGGEAVANGANVADNDQVQALVADVMDRWGRVDILVNNAGILRDKSFHNMDLADFRTVIDVHLMGSVYCTKAVWGIMRDQNYGRIVMTSSSSGLWGNFGQANYGAAKMALVGLMNTLAIEGKKYNIRVNALAPAAATRMTENLIPDPTVLGLLRPDSVSPGLLALVHEEAPTKVILGAGAGSYAVVFIEETEGIYLGPEERSPDNIVTRWDEVIKADGRIQFDFGGLQTQAFAVRAAAAEHA